MDVFHQENIRTVKYFINSSLVKKEIMKWLKMKRKCFANDSLAGFSNLTTSDES